mmetsp:Transcript_74542/g.192329  ORF Transcript_74542/g.192329 Transcript_74542/m.192329 type:complete len:708 (-) Transcript_74542:294-2417(-)
MRAVYQACLLAATAVRFGYGLEAACAVAGTCGSTTGPASSEDEAALLQVHLGLRPRSKGGRKAMRRGRRVRKARKTTIKFKGTDEALNGQKVVHMTAQPNFEAQGGEHSVLQPLYVAAHAVVAYDCGNATLGGLAQGVIYAINNGTFDPTAHAVLVEDVQTCAASTQSPETAQHNSELITGSDIANENNGTRGEDTGGPNHFQGDMVAANASQMALFQRIAQLRGEQVAAGTPWTNARVPYCFASDVGWDVRHVTDVAMAQFNRALPCMQMVNVGWQSGASSSSSSAGQACTESPAIFIQAAPNAGCYSYVGMIGYWTSQQLNLGQGCASLGIAIHEIGHAIGMAHEQSRPDRDNAVIIHWDNIQSGVGHNFNIDSNGYTNQQYDYLSVMHYDAFAFALDYSTPTISKVSGGHDGLGQRVGLSASDVEQLEAMYQSVAATCSANALAATTGCIDEKDDNGNDVCTGISQCGGSASQFCCACGAGIEIQCYTGSECPQTDPLPPGPEADCIGSTESNGWCYIKNDCDYDIGFTCDFMSCTITQEAMRSWTGWSCGGAVVDVCNSKDQCSFWNLSPTTPTPAPTTSSSTTAAPTPAPTPAPTTAAPNGQQPWQVVAGPCSIDSDRCATSPNYPQPYNNNQACTITVNVALVEPLVADSFTTESGYDLLRVNGQAYSGTAGPVGVVPSAPIYWTSDYSVVRGGWRLCMSR